MLKSVNKILSNSAVEKVMYFVSLLFLLAYLGIGDFKLVVMYVSIAVLSTYFTKNKTVNMLASLIITNIFVVNNARNYREGFSSSKGVVQSGEGPSTIDDEKNEGNTTNDNVNSDQGGDNNDQDGVSGDNDEDNDDLTTSPKGAEGLDTPKKSNKKCTGAKCKKLEARKTDKQLTRVKDDIYDLEDDLKGPMKNLTQLAPLMKMADTMLDKINKILPQTRQS